MPIEPPFLVPDQQEKAKRVFESDQDYDDFCESYYDEITPELERLREARQQSEEEARSLWFK